MAHVPSWHILDNLFTEQNEGLTPPERRTTDSNLDGAEVCRTDWDSDVFNTLVLAQFRLRIANLDHNDPPGYASGAVARGNDFNANSGEPFRISAEPRTPVITVRCEVEAFDPASEPIYWRLQCRHVLCRHQPQGNYRYRGACEILEVEWQGKSRSSEFKLFEPASSPTVDYDYNTNDPDTVVMGGNAILTVAAMPRGCTTVLTDYVHLRIGGTNPAQSDVTAQVNRLLGPRNPNLPHIVNAIYTHENNFAQFSNRPQRAAHMIFKQKHHNNDATQPDCNVLFDWPDDPEHFPSVSFDWGVGISQYTKIRGRTVGPATAWDWRHNINRGINEILETLAAKYKKHLRWRQWAHRGWKAYNGSGPQAEEYANTVEALPEGQAVSNDPMPDDVDVDALTAPVPEAPNLGPPPSWPPFLPPGDYPMPNTEEVPV